MSVGESVKETVSSIATQAAEEVEKAKTKKLSSKDNKLSQLERKIETLRNQGGFEGAIARLELQKSQLKNKLKHIKT